MLALLGTGCGPYLQGWFGIAAFEIVTPDGEFVHEDFGFAEFDFDDSTGFFALRYDVAVGEDGAPVFVPRPRLATSPIGIETYSRTQDWTIGPFQASWKAVRSNPRFHRWEPDESYATSLPGAEEWQVAFELER